MQEPAYKPDQWIIYQQGEGGGFGQIVGGRYSSEAWIYSIKGPITDTTYASVREDEITFFNENGSWLEPQQGSLGKTSAYSNEQPS